MHAVPFRPPCHEHPPPDGRVLEDVPEQRAEQDRIVERERHARDSTDDDGLHEPRIDPADGRGVADPEDQPLQKATDANPKDVNAHLNMSSFFLQGKDNNSALKEIEKAGKLANDLNGYNKKNKLGISGLSPEAVEKWLK